jgi:hypothetical protein
MIYESSVGHVVECRLIDRSVGRKEEEIIGAHAERDIQIRGVACRSVTAAVL